MPGAGSFWPLLRRWRQIATKPEMGSAGIRLQAAWRFGPYPFCLLPFSKETADVSGHRDAFSRLKESARAVTFSNPLYHFSLAGKVPAVVGPIPPDPWPGDAARANALLGGIFSAGGQSFPLSPEDGGFAWLPEAAGPRWLAAAHGFCWLRDLRAVSGDDARRQARLLVAVWIEHFGSWHPVAWRLDWLGARLAAWIQQHDFFCLSADDAFRSQVYDSLVRQARHLGRVLPDTLSGTPLIAALKGLILAGLALEPHARLAGEGIRLLEKALPQQVLPDGGHVSRSPQEVMTVLRHLIDIRAALRIARAEVPEALQHAIDRMTPALRFFRHGDNGLALFNGSREEDPTLIETVLTQADARGRPLKSAPHTGFERLLSGRTLVLMDTGVPAAADLATHAHAGTLAFELSVGKERLIVNCGSHPTGAGPWQEALAGTAAHSTVSVAGSDSSEVLPDGSLGRRPDSVRCERQEYENAILVEATHSGYGPGFGLIHRRRLYLAENGEDLRGEDSLEPLPGLSARSIADQPFAIRFHLHPAVQASLIREGTAVLLRLPSGAGWRMRVQGAELALEDSIYFGRGAEPRRSRQIVLTGDTQPGATQVKWALRREKKGD